MSESLFKAFEHKEALEPDKSLKISKQKVATWKKIININWLNNRLKLEEKFMKNTSIDKNSTPAIFFVLPFLFIPLVIISWMLGGISIVLIPLYGYFSISLLDFIFGSAEQTKIDYKEVSV